ncbi:hypothetical protein PG990_012204 [Apiospora arundinis]
MSEYTSTREGFQRAMEWSLIGQPEDTKQYVEATTVPTFYQVMNGQRIAYDDYVKGIVQWRTGGTLHEAVINGYDDIVKLFLNNGDILDEINTGDYYERTALQWAVENERVVVTELLINKGASAFAPNITTTAALERVRGGCHKDIMNHMCKELKDKSNNKTSEALIWAVENNEFDVAIQLVHCTMWRHRGDESDVGSPILSWGTLLQYAVEARDRDLEQQVLSRKMLLNATDGPDRMSPLAYAARGGLDAVVQLLLRQESIIVDILDKWEQTPLIHAAIKGQEAILSQLIDKGADINTIDREFNTPLMYAVETGHEGVVQQLLSYDHIDVDVRNITDCTALMKAAGRGNEEVVKQLLHKRARVEQRDVDQAHAHGHKNVEELLEGQLKLQPHSTPQLELKQIRDQMEQLERVHLRRSRMLEAA